MMRCAISNDFQNHEIGTLGEDYFWIRCVDIKRREIREGMERLMFSTIVFKVQDFLKTIST